MITPEKVDVRGVCFDNVTLDEAVALLRDGMREGIVGRTVFTPNAEIVQMCIEDEEIRRTIRTASLVVPDGIGVIKAARILKTPLKEKVAGVDLGRRVLSFAAEDGYRVFFLGGKPGVAEAAAAAMQKECPALTVCGVHDGYFDRSGSENDSVLEAIRQANTDILYVCFGAPTQEKWIAQHRDSLPCVKLFLGLGGSLDVYAGTVRRAPELFIRLGLEWLYRLLSDPRRIGRMMRLPKFYFGTWKYRLTRKKTDAPQ